MRRQFSRPTLVLLATSALATGSALAQEQEQPAEAEQVQPERPANQLPPGQVPAVLKAREANFTYRSSSRVLSCDQLRNHVAVILAAVGARQDVQVRANECESFMAPTQPGVPRMEPTPNPWDRTTRSQSAFDRVHPNDNDGRSQSTPVHIQVMMPVEITPDVLTEVEQDKARRELVSRVTGNPGAALDNPIFFPAERRQITLSWDTIKVDYTDCELLEQMSQTVFRQLDLKVTGVSPTCDRASRSRMKPHLTVEALLPVGVPMPGEKAPGDRPKK
jgi:hypothetical protein